MNSGPTSNSVLTIEELLEKFSSGSVRQKRSLIASVEERAVDLEALGPKCLSYFDPEGDDWAAGWILQVLKRHYPETLSKIENVETTGWFSASSLVEIDYAPLQKNLLAEEFEEADRFTSAALRQLAGKDAKKRGYVYFSEVPPMSGHDLVTIDRLWRIYSQGKFGFSIQARLLNSLKGRYELLWPRIGWKKDGVWTRYPSSFDWSMKAPEGHMPLVNQLRGVRLMDALLNHPSFKGLL